MDINSNTHHAVIVSRINCWKCKDIEAVFIRDGLTSKIVYWHEGGAELLAHYKYIPSMLPCTLFFNDKELLWCADGLSGFLEKWEEVDL